MNTDSMHRKLIRLSAWISIVGILFSGPAGVLIISLVGAQPAWESAEVFIGHYHPIQGLPFIFGFIMLFGFVMFISAVSRLAEGPAEKTYAAMSLVFAAVYATMIGANYMVQATYVPIMMERSKELTSILTMANPESVSWLIEMYGYGFLGLSGWLLAPVFKDSKRRRQIRYLLILNGAVSVLGAIITAFDVGWVLSIPGLISYVVWNLLIVVLMILVLIEFRRKSVGG